MAKRKNQQFAIFKFTTSRLKNANYNVVITPNEARRNGELISIGDSQVLDSLRKLKGNKYSQLIVDQLLEEKKQIKKKSSSQENAVRLRVIGKELDEFLFVPEIISIVVENIKSYNHINGQGLFVNNKRYVRFLCGAGMARRNTVWFICDEYEAALKRILNNDRNDVEFNPSKFNAYFALAASTALKVSRPYFCVVPDLEITRNEHVEFITEIDGEEDHIEEVDKDIVFNIFDGQGVISPRKAMEWAEELELDYIPSAFIIRTNFIKGLVVVIDFLKFAEIVKKKYILDIYGDKVNILNMDIILTKSQFKMSEAFDSHASYNTNSKSNNLNWWVSRYAPQQEKKHAFMNYQFLQVLDLDNNKIKGICEKTVDYFSNIFSNELDYTLLYLLGENLTSIVDLNMLEKVHDNITKAIILNNKLINDPYIKNHIASSLGRKINDSYIGRLIIDGFYTFMVSDPYAFLEYIFEMPVNGLLKNGEHYNRTWLDKGENKTAALRAPLTWRSEVDILTLVQDEEKNEWYQYLNSCVIFNIHGMDMAILAGGDFDGDLACLTNNKQVLESAYGGLPIFYDTNKAPKSKIIENELYLHDTKGFNTKVGFLTNLSTTMYAMLPMFRKNSREYKELIKRLKLCRKIQGTIIDGTKGLMVKPIPKCWYQWSKVAVDMDNDEIANTKFNNSIIVDKRPLFMRFLYHNYNRSFKRHFYNFDLSCIFEHGVELKELLLQKDFDDCKRKFLADYKHYGPLLDTNCVINRISSYMQKSIKKIKKNYKPIINDEMILILKDGSIELDREKLKQLYNLYKKYKNEKRNFSEIKDLSGERRFKVVDQYNKMIRKEAFNISSNIQELANLAVTICYEQYPKGSKAFAWNIFGEGIVKNIWKNRQKEVRIPFLDKHGNIEYLGNKYSSMEVNAEDEELSYDI